MLELPSDEVPPEHIWHHPDRLEEWFAGVKQRRKDAASGMEPVPEADEGTVGNELTKGLRD